MNTRQRGKEWEQKVCRYLKDKGYFIVDINFACACGEIDIIAVFHLYKNKRLPLCRNNINLTAGTGEIYIYDKITFVL